MSQNDVDLRAVVEALCAQHFALEAARCHSGARLLPSVTEVARAVEGLRAAFFPRHFGASGTHPEAVAYAVGATLDRALAVLREQVLRGFAHDCTDPDPLARCRDRADLAMAQFTARLPEVQRLLGTDVIAAYEGDPAARSADETLFCYPGIQAMIHHRIAHELYRLEVPLIARMIAELSHSATGIDIHPGAQIGPSFFIDHGTGVVIGETAVIGSRVRIYQGVTLGARSFPLDSNGNPVKGIPRHPLVQDDVVIYAGATILGRVTIGAGSSIGGNVWLTRSVPPQSRISQTQTQNDTPEAPPP